MFQKLESKIILVLLGIIVISVAVYHLYFPLSLLDAYYFVITTLTTVGYGDFNLQNTTAGVKIFGTFLMLIGAANIAIIFGMITNHLMDEKFESLFGRFKAKMKNHTILVGWNKTAEATLQEVKKISKVCIVTRDEKVVKQIKSKNVAVIIGDGTDDTVLLRANIKSAENVITVDEDDSRNVMITLMVKKLNHKAKVISAANEVVNMKLLYQAGADEVISPDVIGGRLLTSAIFENRVVDLIKDATFVGEGTNIEQIEMNVNASVKYIQDNFMISVLEEIRDGKRYSALKTTDMMKKGNTIIVFGYINNIKKAVRKLG